jgi:hypothetical protein
MMQVWISGVLVSFATSSSMGSLLLRLRNTLIRIEGKHGLQNVLA